MKQSTYGRMVSIGAACAVPATSTVGSAPANAAATVPTARDAAAERSPSVGIHRLSANGNGAVTYNRWE